MSLRYVSLEECRRIAALDGDRFVGMSAEIPAPLSVPGGADIPALGITWVSVELTHRRRGILRTMLEHQLRTHAELLAAHGAYERLYQAQFDAPALDAAVAG